MANYTPEYRVFSLTWPSSVQIYRDKEKRLHKRRVQLAKDWFSPFYCFGTPTWPPFHFFETPIWPPWRHVKTLYNVTGDTMTMTDLKFYNPWWTCPLIEFRRLNSN